MDGPQPCSETHAWAKARWTQLSDKEREIVNDLFTKGMKVEEGRRKCQIVTILMAYEHVFAYRAFKTMRVAVEEREEKKVFRAWEEAEASYSEKEFIYWCGTTTPKRQLPAQSKRGLKITENMEADQILLQAWEEAERWYSEEDYICMSGETRADHADPKYGFLRALEEAAVYGPASGRSTSEESELGSSGRMQQGRSLAGSYELMDRLFESDFESDDFLEDEFLYFWHMPGAADEDKDQSKARLDDGAMDGRPHRASMSATHPC